MSAPRQIPRTFTKPVLICDFDGTLTTKDTLEDLVLCVTHHRTQTDSTPSPSSQPHGTYTQPPHPPEWSAIAQEYFQNYTAFKTRHARRLTAPSLLDNNSNLTSPHTSASPIECTFESLVHHLDAIRSVEEESNLKVQSCRLLQGVTRNHLLRHGEAYPHVREGVKSCIDTWRRIALGSRVDKASDKTDLYIVSLNWSSAFIEGVCRQLGLESVNTVIHANEFTFMPLDGMTENPPHSTGQLEMRLITAGDKVGYMKNILAKHPSQPCIYVGDTLNDLPCMLLADYGIWVRTEKLERMLLDPVLAFWKISAMPLRDVATAAHTKPGDGKWIVYIADSWKEIEEWMVQQSNILNVRDFG